MTTWHKFFVDLFGTYTTLAKVRHPVNKILMGELQLSCMTFINPERGWFKLQNSLSLINIWPEYLKYSTKYGFQDILDRAKLSSAMALNSRVTTFHCSNIFMSNRHAPLSKTHRQILYWRKFTKSLVACSIPKLSRLTQFPRGSIFSPLLCMH